MAEQTAPGGARTLYISGPMTGLPGHNLPAFAAAGRVLTAAGYEAVDPGRHGEDPKLSWQDYLRRDLAELLACEAVAVLPGWERSRGAVLETTVARALGMTVATVEAWVAGPDPGTLPVPDGALSRARVIEALGFDADFEGDEASVLADISERVAQADHCLTRHAPAPDGAPAEQDPTAGVLRGLLGALADDRQDEREGGGSEHLILGLGIAMQRVQERLQQRPALAPSRREPGEQDGFAYGDRRVHVGDPVEYRLTIDASWRSATLAGVDERGAVVRDAETGQKLALGNRIRMPGEDGQFDLVEPPADDATDPDECGHLDMLARIAAAAGTEIGPQFMADVIATLGYGRLWYEIRRGWPGPVGALHRAHVEEQDCPFPDPGSDEPQHNHLSSGVYGGCPACGTDFTGPSVARSVPDPGSDDGQPDGETVHQVAAACVRYARPGHAGHVVDALEEMPIFREFLDYPLDPGGSDPTIREYADEVDRLAVRSVPGQQPAPGLDDEDERMVQEALRCAASGRATHWPAAAGFLAAEVLRLRGQPAPGPVLSPEVADELPEPDRWHIEDDARVPAWDLPCGPWTEAVAWSDGVQLGDSFEDIGPAVYAVEATARGLLAAVAWHRHLGAGYGQQGGGDDR